MKTIVSKILGFVFIVVVVLFIGNILMAAIEPFMPLIGVAVSIIVVLATLLVVWRFVSARTKRFW